LSLFAALHTATAYVLGRTAARHTSKQFVAFLQGVLASKSTQREIHVTCDNVSSHKTELGQTFLAEDSQSQIHCPPKYYSWPDQVENWFSRNQPDVISGGVFA